MDIHSGIFVIVNTETLKIQPKYVSQGLFREAEPRWQTNTIGDLLRDLAVCSDGGWLHWLCEAGVLLSSAGVQDPRTGSQDVTSGKQGHVRTHKDGLESALVSQHF